METCLLVCQNCMTDAAAALFVKPDLPVGDAFRGTDIIYMGRAAVALVTAVQQEGRHATTLKCS